MDFTREPLVETVITPKEGFKLIIRASSGNSEEEYSVGAVEVVSFGNCYFFRSLEKPKAFLLPMAGYEVVEARETRTVLKKPQIEQSIKIGGGKKEDKEDFPKEEQKKRDKKRSRKRRPSRDDKSKEETLQEEGEQGEKKEVPPAPTPRRTLLPPPTSLISDQIDRYKNYLVEQGALLPEGLGERQKKIEKIPQPKDQKSPRDEIVSQYKIVDINEEAHVPFEDEES